MALKWFCVIYLGMLPYTAWGAEDNDPHAHSKSSHEHASSTTAEEAQQASALTTEQQTHLDTAFEECAHNAYTLKANKQKFCLAEDGAFKACENPGTFLDPVQLPPDSTAAVSLLMHFNKCVYCRPGGHTQYNQQKCLETNKDLVQMEQIQSDSDQKSFEDKMKYYLEDLPQGLVAVTKIGMKMAESYKKIRKALEDLKGKKKPPPPPPPPGEEPIGPAFFWPPEPPPQAPPSQPFAQGGATQTARADNSGKGSKFLGFGEDKKSKDKGGRKSASPQTPGGGSSGSSGGGSGGGVGGGDAGALGSGSAGQPGQEPYAGGDKNVAFGGSGGGSSGGGDTLENQLLGELLSEDNKVKSRLQAGGSAKDSALGTTSATRTGIVLLLERVRYTTEKTMGEIYIPASQE